MNKSIKILFTTLFVLGITLLLTGVSFAWFNYRKETADQQLIAGDIYLRLTEGDDEIELSNIFPETKEEARNRNDNYITFEVSGINTSNKTVYYEFILGYGEDKASPKSRYTDSDLRFDLVELDSNGDEISYLLDAVGYDSLENHRIYVDTIDSNTTSNLTRYYKLRMWLDENVLISDSLPDANYTATDYPNRYATIKLTVAGDFSEKDYSKSLYAIMKKSAVMDNINSTYVNNSTPGIDFGNVSSDTNGKGVYIRSGTENDAYPIMYYRGAVEDNNVVFNNKCWKAVRTTDTGGVKLIYNGETSAVYEEVPLTESQYTIPSGATNNFTFNSTDNSWEISITDNSAKEISFTVPAGEEYTLVQTGTSGSSTGGTWTFYKDGTSVKSYGSGGGQPMNDTYEFGTLTSSNVIKWTYTGSSSAENPITFKLQIMQTGDLITENGCDNIGENTHIDVNGSKLTQFSGNNLYNSPAYVGYMYGTVYPYSYQNWTSGAKFGSGFTWDGTNYKLTDATETTPNDTHHYSCNSTDADATCTSIRYVYWVNESYKNYITISDGKGIEEAIKDMQTNTTPSNAKIQIDAWYLSNMNTVTGKLEDTVWCNDRSIGKYNGWSATGTINGSISDYKSYSLLFGAFERSNYASGTSTVKNQPSLACANKNDAFTVNNGNGNQALTYPVALLTEDEMVLAGGLAGSQSQFYLNNGSTYYWSLSPFHFDYGDADEFAVVNGFIDGDYVYITRGLRPSISLKHTSYVASGDGSVNTPYVIE